ncbi:methionine ABC transporter ATP-binding protein [Marinivivus vitaminiproducens]|uniref:methionine ABC transporter ATP-binding protein n=1 Tax=Marinivivus vitaminiproducens TaxID=3035935 RepID=UPI00279C7365|nr:ATP-binding cassette domain-containing protein [Geminicoccaceae bacterium SCSIO 64248]
MIRLTHITKDYAGTGNALPVRALDDVSLDIRAGEVFGIIGRSGAGKSTLIRLINLLEEPTEGAVEVDGVDLVGLAREDRRALRDARRGIGMIFQHFNLLSSRTVFGNVALPLELRNVGRKEREARVSRLLELVGLGDKRHVYPAALSGGQKQRVAIARALATEPKVLLCDEATSALDPETTRSILELLARINRELGLTIVLITHQMAVIKAICQRVAVIDRGRIVETADLLDLFARPQSDAARRLIADVAGDALPESLRADLRTEPVSGGSAVLRIRVQGDASNQPVLFRAARRAGIDLTLVHAQVETVRGQPFGSLIVSTDAGGERLETFRALVTAQDFDVELLGHVPGNLRAVG